MKNNTEVLSTLHSEYDFRALFDSSLIGIYFTCSTGEIFEANDSFLKIVGYNRDDLNKESLNWEKLTPVQYQHMILNVDRELKSSGIPAPIEKEYIRKDGSRVPVLVGISPVKDVKDRFFCFVLDLSETRKIQNTLFQVTKAATLGQFTSEIIHDINNILSIVMITSEALLANIDISSAAAKKNAEIIFKSVSKAAALTSHLMRFARGLAPQPQLLRIGDTLKGMIDILKRLLGKNYELISEVSNDLFSTRIDLSQMEQVILNLSVNARDAMSCGGTITITIDNIIAVEPIHGINNKILPVGRYVKLSVKDTGCGMDQKLMEHIFEPFFTTKSQDKGSGIGLATVLRIVEQASGTIIVQSTLGKGSDFHVYLPAYDNSTQLVAI